MNDKDIKVGIIIPIYNVENYLKECISSVINQTYKNIDIILINDGSTDCNSFNIAKEFAKIDERIILIDKENGGLGNARNVGINWLLKKYKIQNNNLQDGLIKADIVNNDEHRLKHIYSQKPIVQINDVDYILYLDSDDYLVNNAVYECVKVARDNDIIWFDFKFFYDEIKEQDKKTHHEQYNINHSYKITANEWLTLLEQNDKKMFWFGRHGMVSLKYLQNIKLEFINDIIHEDHYYGKILFIQAKSIYILNKQLYVYRIRPNSIMAYDEKINISNLSKSVAYLYDLFNQDIIKAKQYYKDASLAITAIRVHNDVLRLKINDELKNKFIKIFYRPLIRWLKEINNYEIDPLNVKNQALNLLPELVYKYENSNQNILQNNKNLKNKKISIIMPIYNIQEYLVECINSILNQSYKHFNLLLINDGSIDDTLNIAKYYANIDNRIIVIDKINEGQSKSRNLGLELLYDNYNVIWKNKNDYVFKHNKNIRIYTNESNIKNDCLSIDTDYVMFIDGDDTIEYNCLKECIDNIKECEIIWFDFKMFADKDYNGEVPKWNRMRKFNNIKKDIITSKEFAQNMLDSKICQFAFMVDGMIDFNYMKKLNFKFPTHGYAEDHYFGLMLFLEANNIKMYKKCFYNYRVRNGSSCNFNNAPIKLSKHIAKYHEFLFKDINLAKEYYNFSGYCNTTYLLMQYFSKKPHYFELSKMILRYYLTTTIKMMKFFKYKEEDIKKLIFINDYLLKTHNINYSNDIKIRLHLAYRIGAYLYWIKKKKIRFLFVLKDYLNVYKNYKTNRVYFVDLKKSNISIDKINLPKQYVLGSKIIKSFKKYFLFKF